MKLEKLNLTELDAQELKNVQGGWVWIPVATAIGAYVLDNYTDIKKGLYDGWNKQ